VRLLLYPEEALEMQVPLLPPAPPRKLHFDPYQFDGKKPYAVHAERNGDGSYNTTGIAFEDYAGMHTYTRKDSSERQTAAPVWAMNDDLLRALVARYMEIRCGLVSPRTGTYRERIDRAQAYSISKRQKVDSLLTSLCHRYVAAKNAGASQSQLKKMSAEIENVDTRLVIMDRQAAIILSIPIMYWRQRLNSVAVAAQLRIKPPHVRTILTRMGTLYQREFVEGRVLVRRGIKMSDEACARIREAQLRRHAFQQGERFGRLIVLSRSTEIPGDKRGSHWSCVCDCGKEVTVRCNLLRTGRKKSCGCLE
jgi:hypothetical protein